jgi:hypothetical protein
MPQNEKVTFPEGTGGLAASWAGPEETEQARAAHVAIDKTKRKWATFITGRIITLPFLGLMVSLRDLDTVT